MSHVPSFPAFPSFPSFPGFGSRLTNGSDLVFVLDDGANVDTKGGNDLAVLLADGVTLDLGPGRDIAVSTGTDTVVDGGRGNDILIGGAGTDSVWGNLGNDIIRTGAGSDYALGGKGDDFTDTGTGLGIHFGGEGNDTFFIGREIVGNGAQDTIIALDFGNGHDRLSVAPEILAAAASVEGGKVDLVPVLAQFAAEGLSVEEVGSRLAGTALGAEAFGEVASFLAQFQPNEAGQILVDATTVTTTEGDRIIALGVTPDQLAAALA